MILNLLIGLVTDNWQWIAGAIGAVAVAFGLRKSGKDAVRAKAAVDAAKRSEKGSKAATKAKAQIDAGAKPDDLVRKNDGDWQ